MTRLLHNAIAIISFLLFFTTYAQEISPAAMLIKKGHIVQSTENGKSYQLYVSLPSGYEPNGTARYPVLYLLDGNINFPLVASIHNLMDSAGEIEKVIIVAIGDHDQSAQAWLISRTLDYTPSNDTAANKEIARGMNIDDMLIKSGGANAFIKTLQDNIIPFIDKHYKTTSDNGIAGHSLGGLFTTHCLIHESSLFSRYGISSPSLFWNNTQLLSEEELFAKKNKKLRAKVFISVGSLEPEILTSSINAFILALQDHKYKELLLTTQTFENETHTSVVAAALSRTLRVLYKRGQ